jgi:hypothetical protein
MSYSTSLHAKMMTQQTMLSWMILALLLFSGARAEEGAAQRLLRAALSAPGSDAEAILKDARAVFSTDLFPSEKELEELVVDVTGTAPHSCANTDNTEEFDLPEYADRHVKQVNAILDDFDCMEREFDAQDPDFDAEEAAAVLSKCRLLVVRNLFSPETMQDHKAGVSKYINDIHHGRIDPIGKTALGDNGYMVRRDSKRFDVLYPECLVNEELATNEHVMKILSDIEVFGDDDIIANAMGVLLAESGAPGGRYHYDDAYLYGPDSFERYGIAGSDLRPYAITMFTPLQNTTMEHGPTEFCMGTNFLKGLPLEPPVSDPSLIAEGTPFHELAGFESEMESCPTKFLRSPLTNLGDAIFFDYTITHRGGENNSPDLRAMSYIFYSRPWHRDWNFDHYTLEHLREEAKHYSLLKKLTLVTKFAVVEEHEYDEENYTEDPLESIQDFMNPRISVTISNANVKGASLFLRDDHLRHLGDVAVGESLTLQMPIGWTLHVYNEEDKEIGTHEIQSDQGSLILRDNRLMVPQES